MRRCGPELHGLIAGAYTIEGKRYIVVSIGWRGAPAALEKLREGER